MANPTLLDIAKRNASDAVVGIIEECTAATPELTSIAARTIRGINYKLLVRSSLPTVGFRYANQGYASSKSGYENRLFETFILNPSWECDKAVADRSEDGAAAYIADEAIATMMAASQHLGKCFFYGVNATLGDAKGFPGLLDMYDSTNMVLDAGGTTASTGSSVWVVRSGPQALSWIWGNGGELIMDDPITVRVTDGTNPYTAYRQELLAYPGLQLATQQAVLRIKKCTEDSGKGVTDALLAKAYSMFKVGFPPTGIFMSRRSLRQLRDSRTATNPTGAPAPFPTDWEGVPIHVTESLLNTEALTL